MNYDRTQETIAKATSAGWQIVSRDAGGTQFRKPKQWSKGAVVTGVVLLLFWGFGLVVLALAALDYLMAKDKLSYLTAAQLAAGAAVAPPEKAAATLGGTAKTFAIIVGSVAGLTVVIGVLLRIFGRT